MTSATNGEPSESTPLLAVTTTTSTVDPLLSVLPSTTPAALNHPTSRNPTAAKRDLRRLTRANRTRGNGTDTSESSAYSNDNSLGDHVRRINSSFRQLSSRLIEYVAHHTGSIGMLGSMAIAINSLTGPAMLNLPATFARSGVIPTIATLIFVCLLSAKCSLHMANTISKVPGNAEFKKEVEYSEAFRFFWGEQWYLATQAIFLCCITCLNISSIVDTSQVVDTFVGNWWPGGTIAIEWGNPESTHWLQWLRWDRSECTYEQVDAGICLPFADCDGVVFTLGTLTTTLLFMPLALMDLKENAWWQVAGLSVLLIVSVQFVIQFSLSDLQPSYLTWWGDDWNDLLGVVLFNFALVIAIPAWLYEREPHVDVPTVIHGSSCFTVVIYIAIGLLGAMAMPNVADNMLESMMSGAFGTALSIGASFFAFAIVGLGIPLFSVLTRLNLTGSGLCSERTGNILAVYGPFAAAWMLYDGKAVTKLLGWGGIIFTSLVTFLLPLLLSIHVVRTSDAKGSILVYGNWFQGKNSHLLSLYVLLALAILAIFVAILGNLVDFDGTPMIDTETQDRYFRYR